MRLLLFLLKCVVGLFAALGFFIVFAVIAVGVFFARSDYFPWQEEETLPESGIVVIDLAQGVVERQPDNPLALASLGDVMVLRDMVAAIEAAGRDPRIKGLVARVGRGNASIAQVQELRDAILAFREQDKVAYAFAETFGEGGNGTLSYYLATAFDEIWLQPSGDLDLVGVSLESPFAREALDELGLLPRFGQREEYKGAADPILRRQMPEPVRQNLQRLMDSWFAQIAQGISEGRGMASDEARALIDRGPYRAQEALALELVDRLGYWDEVSDAIEAWAEGAQTAPLSQQAQEEGIEAEPLEEGERAASLRLRHEFLDLPDYRRLAERELEREGAPVVALIYGLGSIVLDRSSTDPVFDNVSFGSDTVAQAIADAVEDEEVQAIVFRVDSPGGSYVASDTVWRELVLARQAGKPVIVTMGGVAASGGYFVSAPAERIVAQPGTVTGSIGVVAGKIVVTELFEDLGINWDAVQAGDNARIWSMTQDFTPAQWQRLQESLDAIYADFTGKVAEGRGLSQAEVEAVAGGRIWSGEDAQARGLVDALGGYSRALALARESAGIEADSPLDLKVFPEAHDPFAAFLRDRFGVEVEESAAIQGLARGLGRLFQVLAPVVRVYEEVTADPRSNTLKAPYLDGAY